MNPQRDRGYQLNREQLEAVNFVNGNLLIIASAGTGKTTTIVERYANLIENHDYKPSEILMTTFTNKAAKDMVKKILKRTGIEPPYVGTMHSLFLRILRNHASLILPSPNFTIIDDADKRKILKEIILHEKIEAKGDNVKYFLIWIGKFKNRGILAENLSSEKSLDDMREEGVIEEVLDDEIIKIDPTLRKYVNKIYKEYERVLRQNNLIDLDDILLLTLRIFENNPELKGIYSQKFKAIMVDEAQDLNIVQMRILKLLQKNNLCLIGDDCQNIYEWRGSSNELVFDFSENQNKIFLKDNYRSGQKIIDAVNKVINAVTFKIDKQLNCTREHKGEVVIESFSDAGEEIDFIIGRIKKLLNKKISREEIAVLFRTNRIGKSLERELRRNRIPCYLSKSRDFFEREEIKDIMAFLRLKINHNSIIDFRRMVGLLSGIGNVKVSKFVALAEKHNCSYKKVLDFGRDLRLSEASLRDLMKLKFVMSSQENPLTLFLRGFGYISSLTKKYSHDPEKLNDKLENIKTFEELYEGYEGNEEGIKAFLDGLMELEKKEKTKDKITLSTIHSAKGLEWAYVFLMSCNERILPFYINSLENTKRDSELRLFYVAISRAKDSLTISHYYETEWGKELERSHFLEILDE
ncbi:MAG TPA: ATP-dependent helicase [Candidatus Nanoarchaeia archaeon]|nr:ATP-dependent helicase [Candidatus Nanoarchaeia archaeon]